MGHKPKYIKPFMLDGEEYGRTAHIGTPDGPLSVEVNMDSFTPAQARKFAAWLIKAADEVVAYNRKRSKAVHGVTKDE